MFRHNNYHPRARADADDIKTMLREVLQNQRTIMKALDDLNAEEDSVVATMQKASAAIAELSQELTDANTNDDSAALEAGIAKLETVRTALDSAASAISAPTAAPIAGVNTGSIADVAPATTEQTES